MKAWPKVALGELLQDASEPVRVQQDAEYPNFGIYSFGRGLFAKPPISGMQTSAGTLYRVRAGNFIYSRLFAFEGSYGLVDDAFDGHFTSNEYPSFSLDRSRLDPGFLKAYFQFPRVWQDIAMGSKGVGSRRIRVQPDKVLAHRIPLPPLSEQQAIVARLDTLAEKTQEVEAHLDAVERISSDLLLSLHHKLAASRVVRLGDVLELSEIAEAVTAAVTYPQVGVRGFGGGLFTKPAITGTETSYKNFNRLYAGAIVLSQVKGWEGAIARCPIELDGWFVSPEYRTFRCKPDLASDEYFGELVRTEWFWSRLQEATRGVGARRERTRPEQFLNIELPLPHLDSQLRIVEILKRQTPLNAKHTAIRQANAALIPATLERIFSTEASVHA
jgi:type I restriction enzyme S subunit